MRKNTLVLLSLLLLSVLLTGCGYAAPEKAVKQELELIRQLDESTIKAFVSYEDLQLSNASSQEIGDETIEAVKLFFKNFKYRIRSSQVNEDQTEATVNVAITNIDAQQLAKDLCGKMISNSITEEGPSGEGLAFSFALLKECLEEKEYELVTTEAAVSLTNNDGLWVIQESSEFEDALAGGLVSYLNDPYLLEPQEVLDDTLQPFKQFSADQWHSYLQLDDVFGTGNTYANAIDEAVAQKIADSFDYTIGDVTQDGDKAVVQASIQSFDLSDTLSQCKTLLLEYAQTTESIRATDEELSEKISSLLLEALENTASTSSSTIELSMFNNGSTWEVQWDESFANALLGDVESATDVLLSSLTEEETSENSTEVVTEDTAGDADTYSVEDADAYSTET